MVSHLGRTFLLGIIRGRDARGRGGQVLLGLAGALGLGLLAASIGLGLYTCNQADNQGKNHLHKRTKPISLAIHTPTQLAGQKHVDEGRQTLDQSPKALPSAWLYRGS